MTNNEAQVAVVEALQFGLTLDGEYQGFKMQVGLTQVRRGKASNRLVCEYFLEHQFGRWVSPNPKEIAAYAVEQGGRKIGSVAKKQVLHFMSFIKNRPS